MSRIVDRDDVGMDGANSDEASADESDLDADGSSAEPDQAAPDQAAPDQAAPDQADSDQAASDQADSDQAGNAGASPTNRAARNTTARNTTARNRATRASTTRDSTVQSITRRLGSPRDAVRATGTLATTAVEGVRNLLSRPLASYHLVLTLAFLLTCFGLVMVLSASSVEGYSKEGSAYGLFATQVIFALLGLVVFYCTLRLPVRLLRRSAAPLMVITTILLALVLIPGIGTLSQGARRWFTINGLSVQPSELVKVALCVWGAHILASRRRENASLRELLVPLVPVGVLVCLLIILEPNLSTTITIAIIVGTLLWFAGLPVKVFAAFTVVGVGIAVVLALVESYRSERVMSFIGNNSDPQGSGYQARQAMYALANGGIFGVGLGQSRAKWNYLPNAHNDFIFAIIGEELGLIGGLMVVFLFVVFAYTGFRIAHRSTDPFLRLMTATITVLITAQAMINIGYVIGLLPVTGIQLPLLSAGGTSTLTVLAMLGLLANAARHEPEAVAALSTGSGGRTPRWLRLPTPVAYRPSRTDELRERLSDRRRTVPAGASPGRSGRSRGAAPAAAPTRGSRSQWRTAMSRGQDPENSVRDRPRRAATTRTDHRGGYSPGARADGRSSGASADGYRPSGRDWGGGRSAPRTQTHTRYGPASGQTRRNR